MRSNGSENRCGYEALHCLIGGKKAAADEAREAEKAARDLHIVVEEPWDNAGEKVLVQELHRLSELTSDD